MDNNERSRLSRFLESPWGKIALGAGAAGAVGLTVMVLLRIRRQHTGSSEMKIAARMSSKTPGTPALIESADILGKTAGSSQVTEITEALIPLVENPAADALRAIAALSDQSK